MLSVHSLAAYVGGVAATLALGAAAEASGLAVVWVVVVVLGGAVVLVALVWRAGLDAPQASPVAHEAR
jgi:sugar phosphate permease